MERYEYETIISKCADFELCTQWSTKKWLNISKYIAGDYDLDKYIAFYERGTIFKNGKKGFLITEDAIYFDGADAKVPFRGLTNITYEKVNSFMMNAYFHYQDGHRQGYRISFPKCEKLVQILTEIAIKYNDSKNNAKKTVTDEKTEGAEWGSNDKVLVQDTCVCCLACADACPIGAISMVKEWDKVVVNQDECVQCGECEKICPAYAIVVKKV